MLDEHLYTVQKFLVEFIVHKVTGADHLYLGVTQEQVRTVPIQSPKSNVGVDGHSTVKYGLPGHRHGGSEQRYDI